MDSKNLFTLIILFLVSATAQAAVVTYGSYSHDTDTDIVIGDGLEWLQWDRTTRMTWNEVSSIRDSIEGGGWEIASNAQMASLYNNFEFGITWDDLENSFQNVSTGWGSGRGIGNEPYQSFVSMFGDTYLPDGVAGSFALFGLDLDNDNLINHGYVESAHSASCGANQLSASAEMSFDSWGKDFWSACYGVALVRPATASTVPVPPALYFMAASLGCLTYTRRRFAQ